MATQISYSAADKKKLKAWEWPGQNVATSRSVKMVRPQCGECQQGLDTAPGWWRSCTHDPYWSSQRKTRKIPVWKLDPETGEEVLQEETTQTRRVRVPNILEVALISRSNDGEGPRRFHSMKGYRYLPEIGLAPMCEAHGCGRAWPTVQTAQNGVYCSEAHAKMCVGDAQGKQTTAWIDPELDSGVARAMQAEVII